MLFYQFAKPDLNVPTYLVLHSDLRSQRVICVPLLVEAQAQLLHLVFGLQAPCSLPCVCVTGARCVELLTGRHQPLVNQNQSVTKIIIKYPKH